MRRQELIRQRFQYKKDTGVLLRPGQLVFTWMVRYAGWALTRFSPRSTTKQTAYERSRGRSHASPLVKFGEVVMARVPTDIRACKLDSLWVKGVWVGRTETTDEHSLLTPKGVLRTRSVRRLPGPDNFDIAFTETCKGLPWDPVAGSAVHLKPLEYKDKVNIPRPKGRPKKASAVVEQTVLEVEAAAADRTGEVEVIEMMDTTISPASPPSPPSAGPSLAPVAVSGETPTTIEVPTPMDVQMTPMREPPAAAQPATKRHVRTWWP